MARQLQGKNAVAPEARAISETWAVSVLPRRQPSDHKWSVGGVVVVAGSPAFAGAAALCCAGAARSGAGIVSAALPRSIAHVVVGLVPEVTVVFVPEGESVSVANRSAEAIGERLRRSKALVVGPGLGDDSATSALLGALFGFQTARGAIGFGSGASGGGTDAELGIVGSSGAPVVVDADGLNWLAKQGGWWGRVPPNRLVLTPHAGEMARLTGEDVASVLAEPVSVVHDAATRWGQTVVLKGSATLVASPDGSVMSSATPPALATAGTGDVLSGSIGAFLAQGLSASDAAGLAVFVGARAALRLASRFGTLGVLASDLPAAVAEELCALEAVEA